MAKKIFYLFISLLFLYSGIQKLFDPLVFAHQIRSYELIHESLVTLVATLLPTFEILLALFLWFKPLEKTVSLHLCLLMSSFALAISHALLTEKDINCGCFGADNLIEIGWWHVLANLVCTLLLLLALPQKSQNENPQQKESLKTR